MLIKSCVLVGTQGAIFDAHVQVVLDCNTALLEGKDFLMEKIANLNQEVQNLVIVSIPIMHWDVKTLGNEGFGLLVLP